MRVLIYGINYAPELTGIGKYTGEMAEWLASRGHEVRVVTAPPYYPHWRIYDGYESRWYTRQVSSLPSRKSPYTGSLTVIRCPLWVPRKPSGLTRIIHLMSFALSSFPVMLKQAFWRPDVVFAVAPTLFSAPQAWITARLSGSRGWLHMQDLEIDAAFELKMLPNGSIRQFVHTAERCLLRRFDWVSGISRKMVERIKAKGVDPKSCLLFPNWVDTSVIHPSTNGSALRTELGIPDGKVIALYSGNMGNKQGLEILADAARILASDSRIQFILCGEGAAKRRLIDMSTGLSNVQWVPLQPAERLNDLLNMADIHLLPQRASAADLVMPSKLLGMLASGRPVVATAAMDTDLAAVTSDCGVITPPEDSAAFANAIAYLADRPDERLRLGESARNRAVTLFDQDAIFRSFEQMLLTPVSASDSQRLQDALDIEKLVAVPMQGKADLPS
jgi:colanic acid biosynthesis glycosyl transferase WcaI